MVDEEERRGDETSWTKGSPRRRRRYGIAMQIGERTKGTIRPGIVALSRHLTRRGRIGARSTPSEPGATRRRN